MSKSKPIPQPGNVMPAATRGRASPTRMLDQLGGPGAGSQDFMLRFVREADLPTLMARRLDATIAKAMYAVAECFARQNSAPLLTVGGAKLQHGRGNSTYQDGQLHGTQAAHLGIGTIILENKAVSQAGFQRVRELALQRGIPLEQVYAQLAANGSLTAFGLAYDAATVLAPANINQSEGKLEVIKQNRLKELVGFHIPNNADQLEMLLVRTGERFFDVLVNERETAIQPIENRHSAINRGDNKELIQHSTDFDNLIFGGRETQFLQALLSQARDSSSEFQAQAQTILRRIFDRAPDLAQMAEEARAESTG